MDKLIQNFPVFALEGAAFAGKTTLLGSLKVKYPREVAVIPEVGEYVGGDKNFPDVPFVDLDAAKFSTYFFAELEKIRSRDAFSHHVAEKTCVVMDRCTPLSSLLFYRLLHFYADDKEFVETFYRHAMEVFRVHASKGKFVIPTHVIYVRPKNESVFLSRLARGTKNGVFSSWESFCFLDNLYVKILDKYYKKKSLVLESENTCENLSNLTTDVMGFIKSVDQETRAQNFFDNFLDEKLPRYELDSSGDRALFLTAVKRAQLLVKHAGIKV